MARSVLSVAILACLVAVGAGAVAQPGQPWQQPGSRAGQQIKSPDGGTYVWVPAGAFMMGSTDSDARYAVRYLGAAPWVLRTTQQPAHGGPVTNSLWSGRYGPWVLSRAERPSHRVRITKGFWLAQHEVTNRQYAAFLNVYGMHTDADGRLLADVEEVSSWIEKRGGRYVARPGREGHPVVCVSWYGADEYCRHYGLRLPTEAEWEYAARGPEERRYPWGDEWAPQRCCCSGNSHYRHGAETLPVGSLPSGMGSCGALDMAGNVWEWCSDWYGDGYYACSPARDPSGPPGGTERVVRGGGWYGDGLTCRAVARLGIRPVGRGDNIGFRPVVAPPSNAERAKSAR